MEYRKPFTAEAIKLNFQVQISFVSSNVDSGGHWSIDINNYHNFLHNGDILMLQGIRWLKPQYLRAMSFSGTSSRGGCHSRAPAVGAASILGHQQSGRLPSSGTSSRGGCHPRVPAVGAASILGHQQSGRLSSSGTSSRGGCHPRAPALPQRHKSSEASIMYHHPCFQHPPNVVCKQHSSPDCRL